MTTTSKRIVWLGAFVLAAVVFISYQPSFRMGLYLDDYYNIERAGRIDPSDALRQIFDPRAQTLWYRPLQGLQFFIEYYLFGANANAYHLVNIAYHTINVLLVYALATRISKKWLMGFAAAFCYATFTVYISGVNWSAIVEPLLGIWYLASFWFWWSFLENEKWRDYWLAFAAFILALMAKQTALTIPVIFFLADRLLVNKSISFSNLVRRYAPFVIGAAFFSILQYAAPSTSTFTGWFGWKVGPTMARILWEYFVLLFFPWGVFPSIDYNPETVGTLPAYIWTALVLIGLIGVAWFKRSRALLFLGAFTLLTIIPVLPFPFLEHRYVYLPIISTAMFLGWLLFQAHTLLANRNWFAFGASFSLVLVALANGSFLNDSVISAADWTRTLRVPFRDIERQNPTFPPDTLLYFVDPITPTEGGLSGMFFLRYGKDITVRNWTQYAGLHEHNAAWVYYFDEQRRPQKIDVEKNLVTTIAPILPIDFQSHLRLDGYEVPRTTIKRGTPLALILYWRAMAQVDQDYTVFVHLIDRNNKIVAQYDDQPRKGQAPTSQWRVLLPTNDVVLLPIDSNVPTGTEYKLALGLYDAATGERLSIIDALGQPVGDSIVIESFSIVE